MYKRLLLWMLLFSVLIQGCRPDRELTATVPPDTSPEATTRPLVPDTKLPAESSETPFPTATYGEPTSAPTATVPPSPSPTELPEDLSLSPEGVFLYPVPVLYDGDMVTFQVVSHVPEILTPDAVIVHILVDGERIVEATMDWRNLGGDVMGLYEWVWDTTGEPGEHTLQFILDPADNIQIGDENPDNNQVELVVTVHPASELPDNEVDAAWITRETDCCLIYAISGTAAARDLSYLTDQVETAVAEAGDRLGIIPDRKLEFYFVDRVIGQGGYASSSIVISYLDRDYAGGGLFEVLVHESVHLLDRQFAPHRITFLAEGLAVWITGGHYKPEALDKRVAALLELGEYVPLAKLIDNFYPTQHEVGYLEAAGLIDYLVSQYGWESVRAFYSDVKPQRNRPLSHAFDEQLRRHFGRSLDEIETDWHAYLATLRLEKEDIADLETTIRFYQVMRHYQQTYDPTAYFLRAWLPFPQEVRERGLTADFTRHPNTDMHVTLETMLQAADAALRRGEYNRANVLLDSVERILISGAFLDPLANSYYNLVRTTESLGYEAQQIDLYGSQAGVVASYPQSNRLTRLNLILNNQRWILSD